MRVLVAHSEYRKLGGEDQYVRQLVELISRSHDVELLVRQNAGLASGPSTAQRMFFSGVLFKHVRSLVQQFKPDVIHLHNAYPSLGPAIHLAAESHRIPLVMTVHNFRLRCPNGYMFTEGDICTRCVRGNYAHAFLHDCFPSRAQAAAYAGILWSHRFLFHLGDKITRFIAPSQFMADWLSQSVATQTRVDLIRNFTHIPSRPNDGVGDHGLFAGRLSSEKGVDVLLNALARAGDPPFMIAGRGPLKEPLRILMHKVGLRNTRFVGNLQHDELMQLLGTTRYLVLPSLSHENAPLAVLEAMAHARPLILSDVGGLPELVQRGEGFLFSRGDSGELASAIRRLVEEPQTCRIAGQAAYDFASRELGPRIHQRRIEATYDAAIQPSHAF